MPQTIFDKIWEAHTVATLAGGRNVLYVDRHLIHEVTSPQAFDGLRQRGLKVRRPEKTFATEDHNVPTNEERLLPVGQWSRKDSSTQVSTLRKNCADFGVSIFPLNSEHQGIVHIVGPELGLILPGMITVCGDSHTSTHGAFGAYSLGIGTTEIEMVLATQCLILEKPKTFEILVTGKRQPGVTAKDIVLHVIRQIGVGGGKGCVLLFSGNIFTEMTMEERMTVCNMSIEGGARAGLIEPDQTTVDYLRGREYAPGGKNGGAEFESAAKHWLALKSDPGAKADKLLEIRAQDIQPTVTWGTNPGQGIGIEEAIPAPSEWSDPSDQKAIERAISYMGVKPGQKLQELTVDTVFIGSCTNARISDFEEVAKVVKGKKVKPGVRALVVPGSVAVRKEAERRGLHKIFEAAGFEWRGAGCSMCIAMNGDMLQPQQRAASTSNRNFEGRQGKGGRTHLCSPRVAATTALLGRFPTLQELQDNYNGGAR